MPEKRLERTRAAYRTWESDEDVWYRGTWLTTPPIEEPPAERRESLTDDVCDCPEHGYGAGV